MIRFSVSYCYSSDMYSE